MPSRTATRLLAPLAVLAVAGAVLAGCSGTSAPKSSGTASGAAAACAPASEGSAVDAVKVSGAPKTEPTVSFDAPLKASSTERHVITQGTGAATKRGDLMSVEFSVYNGSTGKVATTTGFGDKGQPVQIAVDESRVLPGLVKTVECAKIGSRIVGVLPPKEAFGSKGNSQFGIGAKDVVVFVVDVLGVAPTKADGTPQPAPAGFPTVKLAKDGTPTVTIAKDAKAPDQTMVGILKQGDGATVASGDTVTLQYQGVNFRTKKVFDESWNKGPTSLSTNGVIPGFAKALVGQKVGSQVIVMIPPADGYGSSGQPAAGIEGTDTLVFVIDILGTSAAPAQ
ncbi:FKBP-type peptidyl-prolyl cis-trans isomerase [Pseudolysinimonas sp.]|uniref:FKBP-type peptidyl-prolyl cis-trans isomerase n=1 Tax=Pseudolysinimonas sp. TaxID=2680009 RepID=UPI003F80DA2C